MLTEVWRDNGRSPAAVLGIERLQAMRYWGWLSLKLER